MGAWEADAGDAGDYLADLVEAGLINDYVALSYFAGDKAAARLVDAAIEKFEARASTATRREDSDDAA